MSCIFRRFDSHFSIKNIIFAAGIQKSHKMKTRFQKRAKAMDVVATAIVVMLSVFTTIYGVFHFGLNDHFAQLGLVENVLYVSCLVMIWMYIFDIGITTRQFNYGCSLCIALMVLLRDIIFPTPLENVFIEKAILTLSILLLCMLTYFYAQKDWKSYTKRDLWMILAVDVLIASLYHIEIYLEPENEYTRFFMTEIWIRPTITYELVACFIREREDA